ncbi:MAG: hypothetical protein ABSG40_20255 [Terriglobales bacterium]|jgi:hypothetical protein
MAGIDTTGVLQVVSQISLSSTGTTVSGFADFNDLVLVEPASPDPVTAAAYTVDSAGAGDVTIAGLADSATPPVANYNVQLYLDGNGHALAITLDTTDVIGGSGFQQAAGASFTAASFAGPYGFGAAGVDMTNENEFDAVGPVMADGVGSISGFADLNWFTSTPEEVANAPVTGTFVTTGSAAANGIFSAGSITGVDVTSCVLFTSTGPDCTADVFSYYLIDATGDNIAIETDANQLTLGVFAQQ